MTPPEYMTTEEIELEIRNLELDPSVNLSSHSYDVSKWGRLRSLHAELKRRQNDSGI